MQDALTFQRAARMAALCCLVGSIVFGGMMGCAQPTPAPTVTPVPTATLEPTLAPSPTAPVVDWENPVYPADFPDPFVLRVDDSYYAYATNARGRNIQVIRSLDLRQWEQVGERGDALPELPDWAGEMMGLTWAPSVIALEGQYVLYYVARDLVSERQCISFALGETPQGPFVDPNPAPLICPQSLGGAIDPEPFVDQDGSLYLLYKNDGNCCGLSVRIYSQRLSPDGLELVGDPLPLISYDQAWEQPLIENPSMVVYQGQYYLIYSANWYEGRDYAVGYAVCEGPNGPCYKPLERPILSSAGSVAGPGGASFFRDTQDDLWIAYHAWTEPVVGYAGGKRSLHLAKVGVAEDLLRFYRPEIMVER